MLDAEVRMLSRALIALMATAILVMPAHADEDRVLVDLVARVQPNDDDGHCMQLEPGRITATLHLVGGPVLPVRFVLGIARDADADRIRTTVEPGPATYSIAVGTGIYCYSLHDESPLWERPLPPQEADTYSQLVAIRLVWTATGAPDRQTQAGVR